MKMKSLVAACLLGLGLSTLAIAAPGVRGGKGKAMTSGSATAILACTGRCTVYSVLSSTATTDFVVLRDTNTANTTSIPTISVPTSATAVTQLTFDPPIIFQNGVSVNCAAANAACGVVFENGAVLSGY